MFRILLATLLSAFALNAYEGSLKTVHHCDYDDDTRFNVFMATILHQVETYNEELTEHEINVVLNGSCTKYITNKMKDDKYIQMIQSRLNNYDIKFYVCKSGMKASGVKESDITVKGVELVPNGSMKLTELQHEGFAYIKTW